MAKSVVVVGVLIVTTFLYLEVKPREKWTPVQGQCMQNLDTEAVFKVKSLGRQNFSPVVYAEAIAIPEEHSSEENIESVIAHEDLSRYKQVPCP